jgi:hypothetical protein
VPCYPLDDDHEQTANHNTADEQSKRREYIDAIAEMSRHQSRNEAGVQRPTISLVVTTRPLNAGPRTYYNVHIALICSTTRTLSPVSNFCLRRKRLSQSFFTTTTSTIYNDYNREQIAWMVIEPYSIHR